MSYRLAGYSLYLESEGIIIQSMSCCLLRAVHSCVSWLWVTYNPCCHTLVHTQYLTSSESVRIYYHTIQNRSNCSWTHNHTACHRRKLCPVWIITSLECLHLINHFSHRNKVHLSHCSCWFQRTLHKLLDHMTRHNTHSLWMGGATSAAEADGCIRHTIKRLWH